MKLNTTLLSYGVISVVFAGLLGVVGYWAIDKINSSMDNIINGGHAIQAQLEADIMHDYLLADMTTLSNAVSQENEPAIKATQNDIAQHIITLTEKFNLAETVVTTAKLKEGFKSTRPQLDAYIAAAKELSNLATTTQAPIQNNLNIKRLKPSNTSAQSFNSNFPKFTDSYHALENKMDGLRAGLQEYNLTTQAAGNRIEMLAKKTIIIGCILTIIIATILARYLRRSIMKTLGGEPEQVLGIAKEIALGNLTNNIDVNANDRTSLLATVDDMQYNLRKLVSQIQISAQEISNGAQEISAGNTNLSQRTEEQASSLEETASSMEQMASTVKQNAENAKQANVMAKEASSVAVKGGDVVNQVVHTMSEINTSSKKIVDIISVIDGIAFQTNILALNAAVEAARAGEQGRGFAVVAAEVRSLAQRSATAAKEIKQLIGDSVEKVEGGTKQVQAAGETMQEIVMAVNMVTDIVNEITAASMEQSAGIDQVNNAITNMDEVVQQNAALVEQAAAAANSLESKAHDLIDATAKFKLAEDNYLSKNNTQGDLNELNTPQTTELPKTKQSRLKAPKAKQAEDWEEF